MLSLAYKGNRELAIEEIAERSLATDEVRVRVHSVGLCKSDVYGYSGLNDRRDAVIGEGEALVMGHEISGFVSEIGANVDGFELDCAVAVNPIIGCGACEHCAGGGENLCAKRAVLGCAPATPGGYAETIVVPAQNLFPLGPNVSLEIGALAEPLCVGAHGLRLADPKPDDSVLVIGGGIVGIGAALAARRRVGDRVLLLEPIAERRVICEQLGLKTADPSEILGSGAQFDLALDCVARPETFAGAIRAVPLKGIVVLVGIWEDEIPLPVSDVVGRETRIYGSYGYSSADFQDVVDWIGSNEVDLEPIIERRVGFDEVIAAFDGYADGSVNHVRTLFQPFPENAESAQ